MARALVHRALRDALTGVFTPPVRVATEIPADLTGKVIVLDRFGGPDSTRMDFPRVDVDVFAPTVLEALELAEEVRAFLRFDLPGRVVSGLVFSEVTTSSGPSAVPYGNPGTRRVTAAYNLAVHDD